MNKCVVTSNHTHDREYDVKTSSAKKCADKFGRWEYGETVTVYSKTGRILSRVIWTPAGYFRVTI